MSSSLSSSSSSSSSSSAPMSSSSTPTLISLTPLSTPFIPHLKFQIPKINKANYVDWKHHLDSEFCHRLLSQGQMWYCECCTCFHFYNINLKTFKIKGLLLLTFHFGSLPKELLGPNPTTYPSKKSLNF